VEYAARLSYARFTAAVAVTFVIVALSRNTVGDARELLTPKNLIALVVLVVVSAVVDTVVGLVNTIPTFRWFAAGARPIPAQQREALRIAPRQALTQFGIWVISGVVYVLLNLDAGGGVAYVMGLAILFGGAAAACMGYLMSQQMLRPIVAASMSASTEDYELPGILARLLIVGALFCGLPTAAIAVIVVARSNGWFLQQSAPIETPILVLAIVSLLFGFRSMVLVARSVADPVRDVVFAMKAVEQGWSGVSVRVYEPSEIGRLQSGFNRMVTGLAERERLRELFGRYVGADVARHALEQEASLRGDVREVAVLYVDLVGSTAMAASRPPQEVAAILNDFFKIVVAAVEERRGLVNKFEGDAVLAVFGAPLRIEDSASAALAAARAIARKLPKLPLVDFGIGITFGVVFAGNIGAENRYEYTVIGDPVNEAARLADHAKDHDTRVLCSAHTVDSADAGERRHWVARGSAVLRGRADETELAEPLLDD
jgi:class 3 adenylate cyclase